MKEKQKVIIDLTKTEEQSSEFSFRIGKLLFEIYDNTDIQNADISLTVRCRKMGDVWKLELYFLGNVVLLCDRCLKELNREMKFSENLVVSTLKQENEDDDTLYVSKDEKEVDISHFVYEQIVLQIPIRNVHNEKDCDSGVWKYLSKEKEIKTNSPFEILRELKDK